MGGVAPSWHGRRGGREFAFGEFLELGEIFFEEALGRAAEQCRDGGAERAGGGIEFEGHLEAGRSVFAFLEADSSGVVDTGAGQGLPGDEFARVIVDDFGVPFEGLPSGPLTFQWENSPVSVTDSTWRMTRGSSDNLRQKR